MEDEEAVVCENGHLEGERDMEDVVKSVLIGGDEEEESGGDSDNVDIDPNQDKPLFSFDALQARGWEPSEEEDIANLRTCFEHFKKTFDKNDAFPEGLDFEAFASFLDSLCVDTKGVPHYIPQYHYTQMFQKFDENNDGILDWDDFVDLWMRWFKTVLRPKSALIIVDVQNDFISGTLAIVRCPSGHRGEEVVPVINNLINVVPFNLIVYSYDWHPNDHISFYENRKNRKIIGRNGVAFEDADSSEKAVDELAVFETVTFEGPPLIDQKLWPRHCVQNTWGSRLHDELIVASDKTFINVYKGTNSVVDSYSAFWDNNKLSETGLERELRSRGITDVFVCGIAYDVCVGATSEHANEYGFRTVLVNDASRGVDVKAIAGTKDKLINASALILDSDRVKDIVEARDRRPELAYRLAMAM